MQMINYTFQWRKREKVYFVIQGFRLNKNYQVSNAQGNLLPDPKPVIKNKLL